MVSIGTEENGWVIEDPVNPPADSTRPSMDSAHPPASTPELRTELALEYPVVVTEPCELQAVLSIVAPPVADAVRAPLRLVAVLDKSGSMRGEKLKLVVKTMRFMLRHLSERDALGLVAYDTDVSLLAPLTHCNAEGIARLETALKRLSAGTQTNLSGGLIRGLEIHKQGVPAATAAHQLSPPHRVRFGNTYKRLTDAEAEARKDQHFGRGPTPYGAERVHEWTMEMHCDNPEDTSLIQKVVYTLHETFAEPIVEVTEAPFKLTRFGWGTFTVRADVHLLDGRILKLEHDLSFDQPEKFRTVFLQLRSAPSPACDVPDEVAGTSAAAEVDNGLVRSTFLFTDGLANVGITDPTKLCGAARAVLEDLGDCRCTVSAFGFGADHNADLLQSLAEIGEGIYSYVEDEDKIGMAFGEALGGLLTTTHQNIRLSLELEPGVGPVQTFTVYPVEGPTAKGDGSQAVDIVLGDLFAEERRDVLISIKLPATEIEGLAKIGHLCARGFSVHHTRFENTTRADLIVDRQVAGELMTAAQRHPQVMRHQNRHTATKALEDARAQAQSGNLAGARRHLEAASEALSASPLTIQGDAACLGLLADLNDCLADLRHEVDFRQKGSKKMACMHGAHMKQRACYGQDFSDMYANRGMRGMKMAFQAQVSGDGSNHSLPGTQSSSSAQVAAGAGSATAGYPQASDNSISASFFQNLLKSGQSPAASATPAEVQAGPPVAAVSPSTAAAEAQAAPEVRHAAATTGEQPATVASP